MQTDPNERPGAGGDDDAVMADVDALKRQASPRQIASKRGLKVQDIIARRTDGSGNAEVA